MRAPSPWTVLGLKGPADRSEVRRAYARRLKQVSPEDDPKGFEQLRVAYEAALAVAQTRRPDEPAPSTVAASAPQSPARPEPGADALAATHADILEPAARAARERLEALLAGAGASDGPALKAALDDLLAPSALEAISARSDTEAWLAELIVANMPRSDPLLGEAFSRVRWEASAGSRDVAPVILRVIGRHEDLAARAELLRPGHPHHKPFVALASPSGRRLRVRGLFAPTLAGEVRDLLQTIRTHHPSLVRNLDPGALAWWEGYLSRHPAPPLALWAIIVAVSVAAGGSAAALNASAIDRLVGCFGALALCFALIAFEPLAVAAIGRSSKSEGGGKVPPWRRLGWAPASAVLLILAPVLPSGPVPAAVVAAAAAACVWWMFVTGERDRHPAHDHVTDRVNAALPTLYALPFLLFTWSLFVCRLSGVSVFSAPTAAFIGGCIVAALGEARLIEFWSIAGRGPARWRVAAGLAAVTLIATILLAASLYRPRLWPLATGMVAVAVLADKAPLRLARWRPAARYQGVLMAIGALAVLPGLAIFFEGSASLPNDSVTTLACLIGAFLLAGPPLSIAEILRGELGAMPKSA